MALHEIRHLPNQVSLAIWKIEEADDFFLALLSLSDHEQSSISKMKGRRKTEWLASRWLWRILAKDLNHGPIVKDEHGKPCIKGSSWQMSISHTHAYAAVIAAPFLVGIDIQRKVAKIDRIAHKFLSSQELEQVTLSANPLDHLHVYWGAKESLYKAYGRRKLDFREQIQIKAFNLEAGFTTGSLLQDGKKDFKIWYERTHEFVLVYAIEIV